MQLHSPQPSCLCTRQLSTSQGIILQVGQVRLCLVINACGGVVPRRPLAGKLYSSKVLVTKQCLKARRSPIVVSHVCRHDHDTLFVTPTQMQIRVLHPNDCYQALCVQTLTPLSSRLGHTTLKANYLVDQYCCTSLHSLCTQAAKFHVVTSCTKAVTKSCI